MLNDHLNFIESQRVGRFATADAAGIPHIIPVCFACDGISIYIALDAKPKRVAPRQLKRIRNLLENPNVALVLDHYSEDWNELAYVMIRGDAALVEIGDAEHTAAIELLRDRYQQYRTMPIHEQPVIVIRPTSVVAWGSHNPS